MRRDGRVLLALGLSFTLVVGACGSDAAEEAAPAPAPAATTAAPAAAATTAAPSATPTTAAPAPPAAPVEVATVGEHLGDGSLGTVEVGPGEAIQIRSLNAISGDVAFL
ncbi:MAG: hypothetical protein QF356_05700, partial [Acidimicrobiales bacterium]|nr:hypothetical protein [Acidimicrobiales bacterium]